MTAGSPSNDSLSQVIDGTLARITEEGDGEIFYELSQKVLGPFLHENRLRIKFDPFFGTHARDALVKKTLESLTFTTQTTISRTDQPAHLAIFANYVLLNWLPYISFMDSQLNQQYENFGRLEDLHMTTFLSRLAADCAPDADDRLPALLHDHSLNLRARFLAVGVLVDLEELVSTRRRSVGLVPDNHPEKADFLDSLGSALRIRFERFGVPADIDDAILFHKQADNLTPEGHPDKQRYVANLAGSAVSRLRRVGGELRDIESVIDWCNRAVDITPDHHSDKPRCLDYLGDSFVLRYARTEDAADIDSGIAAGIRAVELAPDSEQDKPAFLLNLANLFRIRFERLGRFEDLDKAVVVSQQAIDLTPDGDARKPYRLGRAAYTLSARFERLGDEADLDRAIEAGQHAADSVPNDHPDKPHFLDHVGNCLLKRYERRGELADLEGAITVRRVAVQLAPEHHGCLNNLGNTELTRFEKFGDIADVNSAIEVASRAVDAVVSDDPSLPMILHNLGNSLGRRFERLGEISDIEGAIAAQRRASELTPKDHVMWSVYLRGLGMQWRLRCQRSPSCSYFESAYQCFTSATQSATASPFAKLAAAHSNARLCDDFPDFVGGPEMTLRVHQSVLDTIAPFIWLGKSILQRYEDLVHVRIGDAIIAAVFAAISADKPSLALEWLEEGRNVVWGQLHQLRSPLDGLLQFRPDLAKRFADITSALDLAGRRFGSGISEAYKSEIIPSLRISSNLEDQARKHRELAVDYDQLLAEIRAQEGYESFLRSPKIAQLAPASRNGPITVINVHKSRCDALILCPSGHVVPVPLPRLTHQMAEAMRTTISDRMHLRRDVLREGERGIHYDDVDSDLEIILETLWTHVVQPVLSSIKDQLEVSGADGLPHITWCATGPLTFAPLHAAGIYKSSKTRNRPGPHKASDVVVSSYTPSLSALLVPLVPPTTASTQSILTRNPSILIVSQPQTAGKTALPCTVAEANRICEHFTNDVLHLSGVDAVVDSVFEAMKHHDWVHLACHGSQDPRDPTKSAFHLQDGRLELSRLMAMSHRQAQLAVLSACQTAKGDEKLPEEAVHLAAGMLAAGYHSLVATMWSIADEDGPVVSDVLYAALKRNVENLRVAGSELRVAYALHEAVQGLKKKVGERNFARWVPFVHFGI